LIDRFKLSGTELVDEIAKVENHAFDPDATYDRSSEKQKKADDIMRGATGLKKKIESIKESPANPTSQDEIDKLFGKG